VASYPDVILADYHLDNDETGIDVVNYLYREWQDKIPCVIISADQTDKVKTQCKQQGFLFQRKPVKPNALRAALSRFESQVKHR
jgi:CheY-like chemotaxis protein